MRQGGVDGGALRSLAGVSVFLFTVGFALPAAGQQILAQPVSAQDGARVSGFLWKASPSGVFGIDSFAAIPEIGAGIDVESGLGLESANGFILDANIAAGRRHRFIVEYSRLSNNGVVSGLGGVVLPIEIALLNAETALDFREFHAYYNFLLVVSPSVELGATAGVGYFDVKASILSVLGTIGGRIDQAFPSVGTNAMLNPGGRVRVYFELTGFPRVDIDDLSGWQLDLVTRLELFVTRELGLSIGYRRYRVTVDDELGNVGIDVVWDGLMFGGVLRF